MEKFDYIERLLLLAKMNFDYINVDAIFSDESEISYIQWHNYV